ncbi:MAG TPA: response regulator transcription factor [Dehalococcoidia bacterium]|nr:response regulator transcription factor [Dehalococcoidia bacterium]
MGDNGRPADMDSRLRIMLCHDLPVMCSGLRAIIESAGDMEVVGEAGTLEKATFLLDELRPEVIVTDLCLDGGGGGVLDSIRAVKNADPAVKILVLATQGLGEFFVLAMRAGADGYLTREADPPEVVNAIRSVARGHNYVNASIITLLVNTYVCRTRRGNLEDPYEFLSEREREVMCLAATGRTNSEIAQVLHLSKQTVHNLRARVMEKLGLHDRLELLRYAIRRGIVSTEEL